MMFDLRKEKIESYLTKCVIEYSNGKYKSYHHAEQSLKTTRFLATTIYLSTIIVMAGLFWYFGIGAHVNPELSKLGFVASFVLMLFISMALYTFKTYFIERSEIDFHSLSYTRIPIEPIKDDLNSLISMPDADSMRIDKLNKLIKSL